MTPYGLLFNTVELQECYYSKQKDQSWERSNSYTDRLLEHSELGGENSIITSIYEFCFVFFFWSKKKIRVLFLNVEMYWSGVKSKDWSQHVFIFNVFIKLINLGEHLERCRAMPAWKTQVVYWCKWPFDKNLFQHMIVKLLKRVLDRKIWTCKVIQ